MIDTQSPTASHTYRNTHVHAHRVRLHMKCFMMTTIWSTWVHSGYVLIHSVYFIPANYCEQPRGTARMWHSSLQTMCISVSSPCYLCPCLPSSLCFSKCLSIFNFFGRCLGLPCLTYSLIISSCVTWVCLWMCVSLFPTGLSVILWPWPSPELLHKYLLWCWQTHTYINPSEGRTKSLGNRGSSISLQLCAAHIHTDRHFSSCNPSWWLTNFRSRWLPCSLKTD